MAYLELELEYEAPFDWPSMLGFLAARATPSVESVEDGTYGRTISLDGTAGTIEVKRGKRGKQLLVRSRDLPAGAAPLLVTRLRRLFDLDADGRAIALHLANDKHLAPIVDGFPGIRVPGSWDPFETAVRAIIGQVVSVKVATTLAGRLVAGLGEPIDCGDGLLTRLYPTAQRVAEADLEGLGLSGQKIASIGALARAVASGSLRFDSLRSLDEALERLQELPGIGAWTANYIAMRALGEPDAFPAGDLILRRSASRNQGVTLSEKELMSLAEPWRPYRAYAAMLLWASYSRRMNRNDREQRAVEPGIFASAGAEQARKPSE